MKKITVLFLNIILVFGLAACGNTQNSESANPASQNEESTGNTMASSEAAEPDTTETTESDAAGEAESDTTANGNTLVVYFSVPKTTSSDNMNTEEENSTVVIDGEVLGNSSMWHISFRKILMKIFFVLNR